MITDTVKPGLDKGVTEITQTPSILLRGNSLTTRDMLGEYSLQAGDEEENAESFVTTQHSGSRTLQGKRPAVSH